VVRGDYERRTGIEPENKAFIDYIYLKKSFIQKNNSNFDMKERIFAVKGTGRHNPRYLLGRKEKDCGEGNFMSLVGRG